MKQITVDTFGYDELPADIQKKVLERHFNINLDFEWWDSTYDWFKEIADTIGIEVDLKKSYFRGFYSQGDGSSFTASVDLLELIAGIQAERWKENWPQLELTLPSPTLPARILALIQKGFITVTIQVLPNWRDTSIKVETFIDFEYNACKNYTQVEAALNQLEEWITKVCEAMNRLFYRLLRDDSDYLSSSEAIEETIRAKDYSFTSIGRRCAPLP